jgi:hypothetical protein
MVMRRKYTKGKKIHKTKKSAQKIGNLCKKLDIKYRIVKLAKGYRVDKLY